MFKIRLCMISTLGLTALAGSVGSIAATPMRSGQVFVEAPRSNAEIEQRAVSYRDLNLSSPDAQRELMQRVSFAVDSLCVSGDLGVTDPINAFKCNRTAWESVRPQLDNLLVR